ncbi:hemicentin-1-like, partial [Hoplias malabaricus]|uniref:hemicentin-1-like n=1 Tax=Hoplias malabaricus TaxID=27720 RepID=UPI0034623C42
MSKIHLQATQISDSGSYTCRVTNLAGQVERTFRLNVHTSRAVDRTEPPEQVSVVLGSLVTLSCEAHGVPPPTLTWLRDDRTLPSARPQPLGGPHTQLQLPNVTHLDAGLYSCVARNSAGSSTKTFNLTVLEPPRIRGPTLGTEPRLVAVDTDLELECSAEGVPPPTLSWLKDGRPLEDSPAVVQQNGQILKIHRVQVADAGLYTCVASSVAGEDVGSHWVRVVLPPTLLGSSDIRTVSVPVRGRLTLRCQMDGDGLAEVGWFKEDVALQFGGRVRSGAGGRFLEIEDVRLQDSGQYSCVVSNIAGRNRVQFVVEIL